MKTQKYLQETETNTNESDYSDVDKSPQREYDESGLSIHSDHSQPYIPVQITSNPELAVFDYIIVGGGIAGVCTAEMLSRSGKTVLLIEKEKQICSESSGEQHCWGQFGYLYFNLPDPGVAEACIQNVNLLLNAYPLPGNNLTIDSKGQLISNFPDNPLNWYRNEHVFYYYALPDDPRFDLTDSQKQEWQNKLKNVLLRTAAMSNYAWPIQQDNTEGRDNYSNENNNNFTSAHQSQGCYSSSKYLGPKVFTTQTESQDARGLFIAKMMGRVWMNKVAARCPNGLIAKRLEAEGKGINLQTRFIIESHDRPMRSKRIVQSIFNRYKVQQGQTIVNTEIKQHTVIDKGSDKIVRLESHSGQVFYGKKVVFTAGSGLNDIKGANVKTVLSPLLIVKPAICDRHIVYLTPRQKYTINHLHHVDYKKGKDSNNNDKNTYSIIGNGDAVDPADSGAIEQSRSNILQQAYEVFPNLYNIPEHDIEVYFAPKTEVVQHTGERNYHFALVPLPPYEEQVKAAVPGKFTLAMSLGHYIFGQFEGQEPPAIPYDYNEEESYLKSAHLRVDMNGIITGTEGNADDPDALDRSNLKVVNSQSGSSFHSASSKQTANSDNSSVADTLHSKLVGGRLNNHQEIDRRVKRNQLLPRALLNLQAEKTENHHSGLEVSSPHLTYNEINKSNNQDVRPIDSELNVRRTVGRFFMHDDLHTNMESMNNNNTVLVTAIPTQEEKSSSALVTLDPEFEYLPTRQMPTHFTSTNVYPEEAIIIPTDESEVEKQKKALYKYLPRMFSKRGSKKTDSGSGGSLPAPPTHVSVSAEQAKKTIKRNTTGPGMES